MYSILELDVLRFIDKQEERDEEGRSSFKVMNEEQVNKIIKEL